MKQVFFGAIAMLLLASCQQIGGSGNIIKQTRQTGSFKGISAGGAFDVEVKAGPREAVVVEADDNLMEYIETEVKNGVLRISTADGINLYDGNIKIFITAPEITSLKSSGASTIKALDGLKAKDKISLDVSGAGRINCTVAVPEVDVEISGAGTVELNGKTRNYKARVSGSGDLKSGSLMSENTDIHVSGAGSAMVHASLSLKAHASGAGNITYSGGASVDKNVSGAGNVTLKN